jgi:hypothetical protein
MIEEMLDSGSSAEEVCWNKPQLLQRDCEGWSWCERRSKNGSSATFVMESLRRSKYGQVPTEVGANWPVSRPSRLCFDTRRMDRTDSETSVTKPMEEPPFDGHSQQDRAGRSRFD